MDYRGQTDLRVDFGAGSKRFPGFLALDIRDDADIVCDMRKGIPLDDSSVIEGKCEHILEHFFPGEEIIGVINELHRVMHPEGILRVEVPTFDPSVGNFSAFQDPTHKMYWVPETFFYFELGNMHHDEVGKYYGIKPWKFLPSPPPSPEDPFSPFNMRRFMQPLKEAPSAPAVEVPVKKSWKDVIRSWFGQGKHHSS